MGSSAGVLAAYQASRESLEPFPTMYISGSPRSPDEAMPMKIPIESKVRKMSPDWQRL